VVGWRILTVLLVVLVGAPVRGVAQIWTGWYRSSFTDAYSKKAPMPFARLSATTVLIGSRPANHLRAGSHFALTLVCEKRRTLRVSVVGFTPTVLRDATIVGTAKGQWQIRFADGPVWSYAEMSLYESVDAGWTDLQLNLREKEFLAALIHTSEVGIRYTTWGGNQVDLTYQMPPNTETALRDLFRACDTPWPDDPPAPPSPRDSVIATQPTSPRPF
jgi:hypothetical protein